MSVFFINSSQEEGADADSPAKNDGRGNDCPPNTDATNDSQYEHLMSSFWSKVYEDIRKLTYVDARHQGLPLARIKKIMKLDEDVKMISAEVPILFAKAVEIFIKELTLRAWVHTEENKRRTLQRSDIAMAISKCDQFDFLIDIVPRSEIKIYTSPPDAVETLKSPIAGNKNQVQLFFQVGNQLGNIRQLKSEVLQPDDEQIQTVQLATQGNQIFRLENVNITDSEGNIVGGTSTGHTQTIQVQDTPSKSGNASSSSPTTDGVHLAVQQIMTPSGEIQHIPIRIITTGNK